MADHQLRSAYLDEIRGPKLLRSLRFGIGVVVVLYAGFIGADLLTQQTELIPLITLRLATGIALAAIFAATGRLITPVAGTALGCLTTGASLVAIISLAGGVQSGYAPGLMLLFLGMPVLLPLTPGFAASIVLTLLAALLAAPFALGQEFTQSEYFIYACFPAAAAIECIASCVALDRLRFNDFRQRAELRAARDELKDLDRAKSRFTANIHHELRTPLTLMLAPLEALRAGEFGTLRPELDHTLRTMQSNGLRLLKLINNLLDLAKVEGNQLSLCRVPTDPGRIVEHVAQGTRGLAERKGLLLETELDPAIGIVNLDPDALEKILVNLIGNAVKFTDAGSIRVRLVGEGKNTPQSPTEDDPYIIAGHPLSTDAHNASQDAPDDPTLANRPRPQTGFHLLVQDTGSGIPPEDLENVFDRFAQVDSSATRRHEGTGIGLSLVKELVELHGGFVAAESRGLGFGTTIHAFFPPGEPDRLPEHELLASLDESEPPSRNRPYDTLAADANLDPQGTNLSDMEHTVQRYEASQLAAREADAADLPSHPDGTPEVLVVEDNPEMRHLLSHLIGREYRVRTASDGAEALQNIRVRAPELVVSDIMMPEVSGTELCDAIKSDDTTRGIPVMLITSKAEREMRIEGLERGAEDYIAKPFHPRELMARIRALVRLRTMQEELSNRSARLAQSNAELEKALADLKDTEVQLVQAERLAAVGELSAGVAHEVNNPLNFARNALVTLKDTAEGVRAFAARLSALDPDDKEMFAREASSLVRDNDAIRVDEASSNLAELTEIITQGLDRTARLVAELRDFATPPRDSGEPVDLVAVLHGTLRLLTHRLRESGILVRVDIPEDLPPVAGDPGALGQVFLNLIKNSAEALEPMSQGTIDLSAWPETDAICACVGDDGPGMDSGTKSRLFEPFFTTKAAGRGSGLGLSICRRIVNEYGGAIELESSPGSGTMFYVRLPLATDATNQK